ncbi:MAG: glutathione S-transferase N-terminal domain-containing protein [Gaiellaceae bacterium]
MLILHQAEWCPYSSAVRERLAELGVDFVARQVAPWPEERTELQELSGDNSIPALQTDDGRFFSGDEAIFEYLGRFVVGPRAAEHRGRYREHAGERRRGVTGEVLERLAPDDS